MADRGATTCGAAKGAGRIAGLAWRRLRILRGTLPARHSDGRARSLPPAMDDVDRRLLRLLQEDASRPLKVLAAAVDLSRSSVRERIARLEASGVIRRYTPFCACFDGSRAGRGNAAARSGGRVCRCPSRRAGGARGQNCVKKLQMAELAKLGVWWSPANSQRCTGYPSRHP
ncbi:Lrp/AsnC family transcriptional regulator [Sorangium sp. So ce1078]|uniref:Lrp/AsnC family transcriptional regulator n=1 Tax=Sorangium sp. So ce1078 TaxID=3133329 RepID=UPI003F5DE693